jgi:hypothetical protein
LSKKILKYGNAQIILIENYPCNNKDELRAREQYWIDKTPNIVNKLSAYTGTKEIPKNYIQVDKNLPTTEYLREYNKQWASFQRKHEKPIHCACGGKYLSIYRFQYFDTKIHKNWQKLQQLNKTLSDIRLKNFHERILEGMQKLKQFDY